MLTYRAWAWEHGADAACPGGGETPGERRARIAEGLDGARCDGPKQTILAVSHGLPVRYVLDAADGRLPARRLEHVPHATPYRLERTTVERAAETLRAWAASPSFADTPIGG